MINLRPAHVAIYEALTASPATYRTYDKVPQGTAFPYLQIGAISALSDDELGAPTADASFTIDSFSAQAGKAESEAMMDFVVDRLHGASIGGGVWAITVDSVDVFEDATSTQAAPRYRGVARCRVRAE